jgi:hypothetical protein
VNAPKDDFYDKTVMSCPVKTGYVLPKNWCAQVNQISRPQTGKTNGSYEIAGPPPLD